MQFPIIFTMDHIRFLSLNCHGLFSGIISYIRRVACNYDFILLQETWLSHANSHRLGDISNDFVYFHSSAMEDKLVFGYSADVLSAVLPFLYVVFLLIEYLLLTHTIHVLLLCACGTQDRKSVV